jgi:NTE family protein
MEASIKYFGQGELPPPLKSLSASGNAHLRASAMSEAFGIFEGGGAKGLAHIGALKAAEERQVRFMGVAGTSAGSIVAALVAAGYRADQLYDPRQAIGKRGPFEKDFLEFFDRQEWDRLVALKEDAERTFQRASPIGLFCKAPWFYRRNRRVLQRLAQNRGFFSTTVFAQWLQSLLAEKVRGTGPEGRVLFHDIKLPLKIVATDTTNQTIKVFGNREDETPHEVVCVAVAASISIPFFFIPFGWGPLGQRVELVDGGLLSNFPAWVFDAERLQRGPLTPTLGFRLVEKGVQSSDPSVLLGFATRLFTTALSGDNLLEVRRVENLQVIPLEVRASTFDFAMTDASKEDLYGDGLRDARGYFTNYCGPKDATEMQAALRVCHQSMLAKIGGSIHLRANIAMPIHGNRLAILYTYNMDNDADDRLEFSLDAGATGLCWQTHNLVFCDLVDAKQTFQSKYRMTKYQQALVRPKLKSLLSVPIFHPDKYSAERPNPENPILGVLNFDSDEELLTTFARPEVQHEIQQMAADCAKTIAKILLSPS